jgi:hypothetical protein
VFRLPRYYSPGLATAIVLLLPIILAKKNRVRMVKPIARTRRLT